jgi:hypothetical protein
MNLVVSIPGRRWWTLPSYRLMIFLEYLLTILPMYEVCMTMLPYTASLRTPRNSHDLQGTTQPQ